MDSERVATIIRDIVASHTSLHASTIGDDLNFNRSVAVDSLDWFEIVLDIEERFDIMLEQRQYATFGDLRKEVERLIAT